MGTQQITTCDAPKCGRDISKGNGRAWRYHVMSEVVGMKPGTAPRHDAGEVLPPVHFCDETCLLNWTTARATSKAEAEAKFLADNKEA
jgi:hypothetical protein